MAVNPIEQQEMNTEVEEAVSRPDLTVAETLEVFDGTKWWAFIDGPEPVTAKVLVTRLAAKYFPMLPEGTDFETPTNDVYGLGIIDEDVNFMRVTGDGSGGIYIRTFLSGSTLAQIDITSPLWSQDAEPMKVTAWNGVYLRGNAIVAIGRIDKQEFQVDHFADVSTFAWARYDMALEAWSYGEVDGHPGNFEFGFFGGLEANPALRCYSLTGGALALWSTPVDAPETVIAGLKAGFGATVIATGVQGTPGVAYSQERGTIVAIYHQGAECKRADFFDPGTPTTLATFNDMTQRGAGILQTAYGEYYMAYGMAESRQGTSSWEPPADAVLLSVCPYSDLYARMFFYSAGQVWTARVDLNAKDVDQVTAFQAMDRPAKGFQLIYTGGARELYINNNDLNCELWCVGQGTGAVLWTWSDWGSASDAITQGRFIYTDPDHEAGTFYCGAYLLVGVSLADLAGAADAKSVLILLQSYKLKNSGVDAGVSDLPPGDPFGVCARGSGNEYYVPLMQYRHEGGQAHVDAKVLIFDNAFSLQGESVTQDLFTWAAATEYPQPYRLGTFFFPQESSRTHHQMDYKNIESYLGRALVFRDLSGFWLNQSGDRSYFTNDDRIDEWVEGGTQLYILSSDLYTRPNASQYCPYGGNDGYYRLWAIGDHGDLFLRRFKVSNAGGWTAVTRKVETGWGTEAENSAICINPDTDQVFAFCLRRWTHKLEWQETSASMGRLQEGKAVQVSGDSTIIDDPLTIDEGVLDFYANYQRLFVDLEESGIESLRGMGSSSVYESRDFAPYPFSREGIKVELGSITKSCKVTLPDDEARTARALVASGVDFRGKRCVLRRLFPETELGVEGSSILMLDGYIQDWISKLTEGVIIFTVSHTKMDVRAAFPRRTMTLHCGHRFRGARCGYSGDATQCNHSVPMCEALGNRVRFADFQWVAASQRRVMWK